MIEEFEMRMKYPFYLKLCFPCSLQLKLQSDSAQPSPEGRDRAEKTSLTDMFFIFLRLSSASAHSISSGYSLDHGTD